MEIWPTDPFFSSFLLFRKSHSLCNKVWGTSELLLGALLVCERIKPLCLPKHFASSLRFDSFFTYTDVVPPANFSRAPSDLLQFSQMKIILCCWKIKLQYLSIWSPGHVTNETAYFTKVLKCVYMLGVLFARCSSSAVISVRFQPGRLQVPMNVTNETLLDLLEETYTPICHSVFKLTISFIHTYFYCISSRSKFRVLL